jgi:hypothetical protein
MLRMSESHGAFHCYGILDVDILFSLLASGGECLLSVSSADLYVEAVWWTN